MESDLDDSSGRRGGRVIPFSPPAPVSAASKQRVTSFSRAELGLILGIYGRMVAAGEWRDYAIDHLRGKAVFSIFRRASERPLYRIEKDPAAARKGAGYAVVADTGRILRRGPDLARVLSVLLPKPSVVE